MKLFLFHFKKDINRDKNSPSVQKAIRTVLCALSVLLPVFISFLPTIFLTLIPCL